MLNRQYFRIFWWHVLRHVRRHPLLALLNILSVALGVTVYLATQIANQSANRSFAATVDMVAGKAELQITAPNENLPETVFPLVQRVPGVSAATPLVRGFVTLPDVPGEYLEILGVDVFTNVPFRTFEPTDFEAGRFDIQRWLGAPGCIAVTEEFVEQHHLKRGDKIRAELNTVGHDLEIGFILRSEGPFDSHFAAMDIGWAQELFGRQGKLNTIQLRLTNPGDREKVIEELRNVLPKDASIAAPAQRTEEVEKMLSGFELNLAALSLLSLVVGMFLIYNTVSASVARRSREIGILRSIGATRNEVRALFLGEAIVLGSIGAFLGLGGGVLLARYVGGAVADTISSLYILVSAKQLALTPLTFFLAWLIGVGSVVVSAWLPAQAAAKMEPVRALHGGSALEKSLSVSSSWLWSGVVLLLLAGVFSFIALSSGPAWFGFLATFAVLASFSLFVPWVTSRFSAVTLGYFRARRRRHKEVRVEAELGAANLTRGLSRNAVTIAALATAVALTVGISVMVFSFRETVVAWINQTLIADLFIAPAANEVIGTASFVPQAALDYLAKRPEVEAIDTFRETELMMGATSISAGVVRGSPRRHFQFVHGNTASIMRQFSTEECVVISESFARRHHLRSGESIDLTTSDGPHRFPIAGVFFDYSRDQGILYMSAKTFARFWDDDRVNSVAVYLKNANESESLRAAFLGEFSRRGEFRIYANQSLRSRVFEIFDQTFAVTYVLRTIAVIVAVTGIFLSLTILITERSRELAVLRAIGGSAAQVRRILLWETAMVGGLAAVVGTVSGLCLSVVLTGVINRAFFGWTIQLAFPWRSLTLTPVWIVAVAILAGFMPAWRAGRLNLVESLRNE